MGDLILALDQGTTSSRAIVFQGDGVVAGAASQEFAQYYPQDGWVEHAPYDLIDSQRAVIAQALAAAGATASDLACVGMTNQRETSLIWDRQSGAPIMNAVVWQCRRTAAICEQLKAAGLADAIQRRTGLVVDAYFSGTKIQWMLDQVPGARARAERGELCFGTVDSWLMWQLSGGRIHATDVTNASRTMLMDVDTRQWDAELLEWLRVPASLMPEIRPSAGLFGELMIEGVAVPLTGVAGDQQAALYGQRCNEAGMVKCTYGTGCFLLMNTGQRRHQSTHRLLSTVAWERAGQTDYALEGSVFMGGATIQWLRDDLQLIGSAAESEALARSVPDSGGVYLVPAFTGLGAPYWDMYARGTLIGLTRSTGRAHVVRAALEAIAFQVRDLVDAMQADAGSSPKVLRVDGGAAANDLLMQIQADMLGIPVERPVNCETTALGAAMLAGEACGLLSGTLDGTAWHRIDRVFEPTPDSPYAVERYAIWQRAVARAANWACQEKG
jgi:glycerol kinase